MTRTSLSRYARSLRRPLLVLLTIALVAFATTAFAQVRYSTPEEAVTAFITAAKATDTRGMIQVLGPGSAELVHSGDLVDDAATRKRVVDTYEAKHQVQMDGADKAILTLGADDWPFPIPLVRRDGAWAFDVSAGREEILARRIGRNELNAIQASLAVVDAQQEYAEKGVAGAGVYARRIVSRPGQKDGLYWPVQSGEPESPLGELAAAASAEGYRAGERPTPYHGYYYKILTRQGPSAQGGALDYVVRGKMIGGFALLAYPAEYGNSGIMTFLVNHDGVVYQKDLGPTTARAAGQIRAFNPDGSWKKVEAAAPPQSGATSR
jgi:Protein of unknown function (DUF2950)